MTTGDVGANVSTGHLPPAPLVRALIEEACAEARPVADGGVATYIPALAAASPARFGACNPMVNADAIATTSLVPGATPEERWRFVQEGLSRFAGRRLELDAEVYRSEASANHRNRGIAHLLHSYGRLGCDPDEAVDVEAVLAARQRPRPGRHGVDAGRRRGEPGDRREEVVATRTCPPTSGRATGCTRSACPARAA